MAPKAMVAKAYKAMKSLGYTGKTVTPVLKGLLKIYEKSWKLIEDDNYKVLIDAILDSEQQKARKDEFEQLNGCSENEYEETEPLLKRSKRNSQENQFYGEVKAISSALSHIGVEIRKEANVVCDVESDESDSYRLVYGRRNCRVLDKDVGGPVDEFAMEDNGVDENQNENVYECEPLAYEMPDAEDPIDVAPTDSPELLTLESPSENCSNAKVNCSVSPELINLNKEDISTSVPKEASLKENSPNFEEYHSESMDTELHGGETNESGAEQIDLDSEDISTSRPKDASSVQKSSNLEEENSELDGAEKNSKDLLKLDIASSSGGEVKIHLTFNSSSKPDFHVPSLEKVLKRVEEQCLKSYKITQPGFSLLKIMNEICASFLAAGTTSKTTENSRNFIKDITKDIPCACSCETGGEFAYTKVGLVKEKFLDECISINHSAERRNLFYCQDCPLERSNDNSSPGICEGHVVRKFIKECWYKCGCSLKCRNRVVQRGISVKLQVFMTTGRKGWGVRILEDVPKGAFICEYVGEVVTNTELYERNMRNSSERHTYPVLLDADWSAERILKDEEAVCLDATAFGNIGRFVNHRCVDANLVEIPVEVETPDHHYYHLAFFTTRKVNAFEELTWDYGIDFADDTHPVKAFKCHCGSKFCRDRKTAAKRNRSHI